MTNGTLTDIIERSVGIAPLSFAFTGHSVTTLEAGRSTPRPNDSDGFHNY